MKIFIILTTLCTLTYSFPFNVSLSKDRIYGGESVSIEDYPYIVSLETGGRFFCGGSIISDKWVLTAAHCAVYGKHSLKVRAGSDLIEKGGSIHKVKRIKIHPKYDEWTVEWDAALLKVNPPFNFHSNVVKPIKIASEDPEDNALATVAGWGETDYDYSEHLQAVDVNIFTYKTCNEYYTPAGITIPYNMICAGADGKDSCFGDSGGPLVLKASTKVLVGIVSWGLACAHSSYPGVYTDVAAANKWIKKVTGIK